MTDASPIEALTIEERRRRERIEWPRALAPVECDDCAGTGRYGFRDDDECAACNGSGWR